MPQAAQGAPLTPLSSFKSSTPVLQTNAPSPGFSNTHMDPVDLVGYPPLNTPQITPVTPGGRRDSLESSAELSSLLQVHDTASM